MEALVTIFQQQKQGERPFLFPQHRTKGSSNADASVDAGRQWSPESYRWLPGINRKKKRAQMKVFLSDINVFLGKTPLAFANLPSC